MSHATQFRFWQRHNVRDTIAFYRTILETVDTIPAAAAAAPRKGREGVAQPSRVQRGHSDAHTRTRAFA